MPRNLSATSNAVNVTTTGTTVTYCVSKGSNKTRKYIDYVALRITTPSGANGYGNFKALTGNVPTQSNTITF
jgi:hypothetical protein